MIEIKFWAFNRINYELFDPELEEKDIQRKLRNICETFVEIERKPVTIKKNE